MNSKVFYYTFFCLLLCYNVLFVSCTGSFSVTGPSEWVLNPPRKFLAATGVYDASGKPYVVVAGGSVTSNGINVYHGTNELVLLDVANVSSTKQVFQMSENRTEAQVVSVGDLVLIAGGRQGVGNSAVFLSSVEIFNVTSKSFLQQQANITARFEGMTSAVTDNFRAAFIGGEILDNVETNIIDIYDGTDNTWHQLRLTIPRFNPVAVALKNKIYVFGNRRFGNDINDQAPQVDVIDLNGTPDEWSVSVEHTAEFGARYHAGARAGDTLLFCGGFHNNASDAAFIDERCLIRDAAGVWRTEAFGPLDFNVDVIKWRMIGVSVGSVAVFTGGDPFGPRQPDKVAYMYDPNAEVGYQWTYITHVSTVPHHQHAAASVTTKDTALVLMLGGSRSSTGFENTTGVVTRISLFNDDVFQPRCPTEWCAASACVADNFCRCGGFQEQTGVFNRACKDKPTTSGTVPRTTTATPTASTSTNFQPTPSAVPSSPGPTPSSPTPGESTVTSPSPPTPLSNTPTPTSTATPTTKATSTTTTKPMNNNGGSSSDGPVLSVGVIVVIAVVAVLLCLFLLMLLAFVNKRKTQSDGSGTGGPGVQMGITTAAQPSPDFPITNTDHTIVAYTADELKQKPKRRKKKKVVPTNYESLPASKQEADDASSN